MSLEGGRGGREGEGGRGRGRGGEGMGVEGRGGREGGRECVPRKKKRVCASHVSSSFNPNSPFLG